MPELPSATPAPKRATTRWGSASRYYTTFMGDSYTFNRLSRFGRFAQDMRAALPRSTPGRGLEADEKKLPQLQIILRELEELGIPFFCS